MNRPDPNSPKYELIGMAVGLFIMLTIVLLLLCFA